MSQALALGIQPRQDTQLVPTWSGFLGIVVREEQAVKVSRFCYAQPAFLLLSAMLQPPDAEIWVQTQKCQMKAKCYKT